MNKSILLSTIAIVGMTIPVASFADSYRPSQQTMMNASLQHASASYDLATLQAKLDALQEKREQQEKQYANTFEALNTIHNQLIAERKNLEEWIREQVQSENNLLKQIQLNGAPHNVLKIRTRQRQLQNAKKLFAEQREALTSALEEKEKVWNDQWESLRKSQAITRATLNSAESSLRSQIERKEFTISAIDSMRDTGRIENNQILAERAHLQRRNAYYVKQRERSAKVLQKALAKAEEKNYFNTPNQEVVQQIQEAKQAEIEYEQSMQLKVIMERLGITGPVDDKLRASLYLHLFGSLPVSSEVEEEK